MPSEWINIQRESYDLKQGRPLMILKQLAFKARRRNQSTGYQALEVNEPPTHSNLGRMIAIGLTALILYAIGTGFGLLAPTIP